MVEVPGGVGAAIDDTTPSTTTTYSSQKIEDELSALNQAKANNDDLAAVAKSGSYTDLTNKPTIPTVPSTLPNPNALTFTGAVNETYDGSAAKSVAIPTVPESLKNPNKLIFTGAVTAEYDGSAEVSVEIPAGGIDNLPVASPTTLGGVMPAAKTGEMTQAVGVDEAGGLWALPGGSAWHTIGIQTMDGVETAVSFDCSGEAILQVSILGTGEEIVAKTATISIYNANNSGYNFYPQTLNATAYKPINVFLIFGNSRKRMMLFAKGESVTYQATASYCLARTDWGTVSGNDDFAARITVTFDVAPVGGTIVRVEGM